MRNHPTPQRRRAWVGTACLVVMAGGVLAGCPGTLRAVPEDAPPAGFVWEDLKDIRASILRPEKWLYRRTVPALPFYNFSPLPFNGPFGFEKGVSVHAMVRTNDPADERVATLIAGFTTKYEVLRGSTRKNVPAGPFTTYSLVLVIQNEETDGVKITCEMVFVANRVTNTVYRCWLEAPAARWKDVEQTGEKMIASLRLDPDF